MTGAGDLGDDMILDAEARTDIENHSSSGQVGGKGLDQPAHRDGCLILGAAPLP